MQPLTLGKYQLLKRIAAGGMAEIYVARVSGLPGFEKIVVVKRILPQLATNQEFIQMFLDEARIAATLHHPNIVQMYDIGAVDGNYFISMEYLHGEDLRTLVKGVREKGERLPVEHALNVVIGLSAGLHYAHEKVGFDGKPLGIVHRDVTPQNVFITYDGTVKIVDFGIAKASNRFNETRYGTLKGKIPYMSPEQCRSEPLDRRSDIYAIGIMLYELTTGFRLYKGKSEFELLKKIVEEDVAPPSVLRPNYPKALERIVLKALARNREERYQTAQELQADLEAFAREHRLAISSISLGAFMNKIFGNKVEAWRDAQAAGKDLAAAIVARHEEATEQPLRDEDIELVDGEDKRESTPSAHGQVTPASARASRAWVWIAAATALVGAAVAGGFALFGGRKDTPPGPTEVVATRPTEPPPQAPVLEPLVATAPAPSVVDAGVVAEPAAGIAKVSSRPSGARVFVDGKPWREPTPTVIDSLEPGEHQLKLELAGHVTKRLTFQVKPNETTPIQIELHAATQAPAPASEPVASEPGELRIATTPSCEVIVDGKARGSTPLVGLKLAPGAHTVQLVNSRFGIDRTFSVEVRSGEVTKKKYDFPVSPN